MPNLNSPRPIRKVTTAALAGAVTTIALCVLDRVWHISVPGEVTAAMTTLLALMTSYLTPCAAEDLVAGGGGPYIAVRHS